MEGVNEELAINSISHKALSRQKGILCGLRSPNKTRLEENRKGKKGTSAKQHRLESPDGAFGHRH